jgi:16S rRNA (cytosine967-C5)-methyltransferase
MKIPFCDLHIERFFSLYAQEKGPLDLLLGNYFKTHKALGSKDRKLIGDTVYGMVRHQSLLDWTAISSFQKRLTFFRSQEFLNAQNGLHIPEATRLGMPEWFFKRLLLQYGETRGRSLAKTLNENAPLTIRVNPIKTSREKLLESLRKSYPASPCKRSPLGIQFEKRFPLFSLAEFKEGLFEVQDEGSQLIASLVKPTPTDWVLDYCSGSGGKTLGFAHLMEGKGQIYLHDIRPSVLVEAKKRLKRAHIQNGQCLPPGHPQLKLLRGKCDWVLIDVPCSGTGTFRRNPDQKWRLQPNDLAKLVLEQKKIAKEAISYLKEGGKLVYATCSLLKEENEDIVDYLLSNFSLTLIEEPLALLPEEGGGDGFFGASFIKP